MRTITLLIVYYMTCCVAMGQQVHNLKNGIWRAEIQRNDGNHIVFNFESKDSAGKKVLYIRNAAERLLVDDIRYVGDSVLIRLPFFESELHAVVTGEGNLKGVWLKRGADNYQVMPFQAFYNVPQRFAAGKARPGGVAGRWRAVFRGRRADD